MKKTFEDDLMDILAITYTHLTIKETFELFQAIVQFVGQFGHEGHEEHKIIDFRKMIVGINGIAINLGDISISIVSTKVMIFVGGVPQIKFKNSSWNYNLNWIFNTRFNSHICSRWNRSNLIQLYFALSIRDVLSGKKTWLKFFSLRFSTRYSNFIRKFHCKIL